LVLIREAAPVHKFLWWVLAPLMWVWDAIVERELADVPRPVDEPRVHSPGIDCDRILLFGRGPALGWGVLSHEIALSGSLARALTDRTGRGVDVTVVADPTITVRSAIQRFTALRLEHYDAIVITLGAKDATTLTPLARWDRQMGTLLRFLDDHRLHSAHVFILGIQPVRSIPMFDSLLGAVADCHAHALNSATVKMCEELPRTTFVSLTAPSDLEPARFRTAADYHHWGEILADQMAGPLDTEWRHTGAAEQNTEGDDDDELIGINRRIAVEELHILDTAPEDRFDQVVRLAQRLFVTRGAAFTLIDGDRHWFKTLIGGSWDEAPREGSLASVTLEGRGALVVGDARIDSRFRTNPFVVAGRVCFFAGFPIDSPSGERIGVLSVFDPEPRDPHDFDESLLRTCALMIQTELWHRTHAGTATDVNGVSVLPATRAVTGRWHC
jgi:hypothetical protein